MHKLIGFSARAYLRPMKTLRLLHHNAFYHRNPRAWLINHFPVCATADKFEFDPVAGITDFTGKDRGPSSIYRLSAKIKLNTQKDLGTEFEKKNQIEISAVFSRWNMQSERCISIIPTGSYRSDTLLSLGTSGLKISKVILGAMSYGSPDWQEWVLDEKASLPLLEHAYKVGINTWDTVNSSSFS